MFYRLAQQRLGIVSSRKYICIRQERIGLDKNKLVFLSFYTTLPGLSTTS